MERKEILARLKRVLAVIKPKLDLDSVQEESPLTTGLGLDSLSMLLTGLAIESEFGIRFEPPVPPVKVSDVVDYIMMKLV